MQEKTIQYAHYQGNPYSYRGSAPDPARGAHSAPPDPLAEKGSLGPSGLDNLPFPKV